MKLLTGLEVRAEGRTLEGIVMNYGEISPSHRERFLPGSIVRDGEVDVWLDLAHNPLQVVAYEGAGLEFTDSADSLTMRAVLPRIPAAELALDGVRSGRRNGLSVEFKLLEQRNVDGINVVSRARLLGIGLVARPSYQQSQITALRSANGRRRIWL